MTINIAKGQRATLWAVEDKGTYALVRMSTSRKDKRTNEYKNSNWSFVRFVGDAYEKIQEIDDVKKVRIEIKGGIFAQEPYEVDGETKYPKNPQMTIFNFDLYIPDSDGKLDEPPQVAEEDDDDLPF